MRVGEFEITEPIPKLRKPHVIASLRPWVDAGSVGTLALSRLERHLKAKDLASLAEPGRFFDFTRYRPMVYYADGQRRMTIPNTTVRYAKGEGKFDFLFVHILEPHSLAEDYIESLSTLFNHLKIERYCRVGGMYDAVPHTRPILVTGTMDGEDMSHITGVSPSRRPQYQGPTSIINLLSEKLTNQGIENVTLMARLPQYIQLDEDHTGAASLLKIIRELYDLPEQLTVSRRGVRQYERVSNEMERNSGVKALVQQLESDYDSRLESVSLDDDSEDVTELAPSVEQFLREVGGDASSDADSK